MFKPIRITLLAFAICISFGVAAADTLPQYPFISVQGEAKRVLPPDRANLSFTIRYVEKESSLAFDGIGQTSDQLLHELEKLGYKQSQIVSEPLEKHAYNKLDDAGRLLEVLGYEISRRIRLAVDDLELVSRTLDILYKMDRVEDISAEFSTVKELAIAEELTSEACSNAMNNAVRLAKGFGRKVKTVRGISESGFANISGPFLQGYAYREGILEDAGTLHRVRKDFIVIPSTITITKQVSALLELE